MRQTILAQGPDRRVIETDDYGTNLLAPDGVVVERHGTDRHAEALSRLHAEGWQVVSDRHLRPEAAPTSDGGTPGIADAPGPAGTVTDGHSG
ncbi:hypothetical protein JYK14_10430 [Siccirubricoccus sp. KC 17139]|uniref:Uncharacterized protein n=1 Tax=Siccirubricoccus soli TaxID=2899147 RepID=A0ABT1D5K2_9PROT|nr:hypothetical protein [Siccirubricoccus soli]MCO6416575.1 hypothetical protein [Siccirubricoccus soli]MCP2682710.1 hypothetical protein [Siccirubricoccus soli]